MGLRPPPSVVAVPRRAPSEVHLLGCLVVFVGVMLFESPSEQPS